MDRLNKLIEEQYHDVLDCANDRLDYSLTGQVTRLVELLDMSEIDIDLRFSMFKNIFIALCNSKKEFVYSMQLYTVIRLVHRELYLKEAEFMSLIDKYSALLRGPNKLFLINARWEREDVKNIPIRGVYLAYLAILRNDRELALYVYEKYTVYDMYGDLYELAEHFGLWGELEEVMKRMKYPVCEKQALADTVAIAYTRSDIYHTDWLKCSALVDQLKKYGYRVELLVSKDINRRTARVSDIRIIPRNPYKHNWNNIAKMRYAVIYHLDCGYISHIISYMKMGIRDVKLQCDAKFPMEFDVDISGENWRALPYININPIRKTKREKRNYVLSLSKDIPDLFQDYIKIVFYFTENRRDMLRNQSDGITYMSGDRVSFWNILVNVDVLYVDNPDMSHIVDTLHLGKSLVYSNLTDESKRYITQLGEFGVETSHVRNILEFGMILGELPEVSPRCLKTELVDIGQSTMNVCEDILKTMNMRDRSPKLADPIHEICLEE